MKHFSPEALYINWPELEPAWQERYYRALASEIERFKCEWENDNPMRKSVVSCYHAGEPLSFPLECLLDTCSILRVMTLESAEITLASSRQISAGHLTLLQTAGINRINYRVEDTTRSWLAYVQAAATPQCAIDLFLEEGQAWKEWLHALVQAGAPHVSLSFPEGAAECGDAYVWAVAFLEKAGLLQYSTYDFAFPGFASVQQQVYASGGTYKGFGVGACSFDGISRFQTTEDLLTYCRMQEEGVTAGVKELLTEEQKRFERLMLALTTTGVPLNEVKMGVVRELSDIGLLRVQEGVVFLTTRGRLVENEIMTKIF